MCPVAALLGVLSATIVSFHSVSPTAAYLLVPYFGWTLYATGLTFAVYKMNPRVSIVSLTGRTISARIYLLSDACLTGTLQASTQPIDGHRPTSSICIRLA